MTTAQETPTTRRRSSRAVRNSDVKPSSATRRSRGVRQPTQSVLADLDRMISALIKENRELQRRLDKLSRQALGATSGTAERALRSIQRRISSAVDGRATTRRRRSVTAASVSRTPRKITDPEVLERRRQALAKARAARAAKRASAQP
jgi:N-methylhydantoinase B/oxoprolinase/acetone carboxylase alpha subunit